MVAPGPPGAAPTGATTLAWPVAATVAVIKGVVGTGVCSPESSRSERAAAASCPVWCLSPDLSDLRLDLLRLRTVESRRRVLVNLFSLSPGINFKKSKYIYWLISHIQTYTIITVFILAM